MVCPACGQYEEAREIEPTGPVAICPRCGHRQPFRRLPLFVLTGPSAVGKTTVCLELAPRMERAVVLEMDILWGRVTADPADDYRVYKSTWLRVALNVGQAGRPVVLCGTVAPGSLERLTEARYFAAIHYLVLACRDDELVRRLRARPAWRASSGDELVQRMLGFNAYLRATGVDAIDTAELSVEATIERVAAWIEARLP